jgi:hypothetical protein
MSSSSYVLEIKYTDGSSERHEIREPRRILGRSKVKADLQVADAKASGAHAELRFEGGEVTIKDLGSTNGTHFHGTRMQGDFQLLAGESFKVGDATITLVSIEGPEGDPARTMVGAPTFAEEDESTRAVDAATLAALASGKAPPSAARPVAQPAPVYQAPAPVRQAPAPAPVRPAASVRPPPAQPAQSASDGGDWASNYAGPAGDKTPPGGSQLEPIAPATRAPSSQKPAGVPLKPTNAPRPAARASFDDEEPSAPPRKGLRVLLILLAVLVGLATAGFGGLAGYVHVINKEVKGAKAVAEAAIAQAKALEASPDADKEQVAAATALGQFWQKYASASTLGGWAALGLAAVAFFLIVAAFLRGTGMAWAFGLLGTIGGGVLIALTPGFDLSVPTLGVTAPENAFLALFVQPQYILAVMTGGVGLLMLLAVGAGSLGRRAR